MTFILGYWVLDIDKKTLKKYYIFIIEVFILKIIVGLTIDY